MRKMSVAILAFWLCPGPAPADQAPPLLLQKPAVSKTHVAFVFAGDLWLVAREGGEARRLTSGVGLESYPVFSPDGSQVAFAGQYEGNLDVYVIPTQGGVPRRLTYHPGPDVPAGWTPDGKQVLFRSDRHSYARRFFRLFTVPVTGGLPTEVPLPMAVEGSFSPDGKRLAYVPFSNTVPVPGFHVAWKRYRGGTASPVWIADLANSAIEKIPREKSNDFNPMWVGDRVYFLSDRNGPVTLFAYDTKTKKVAQVLENNGPDLKSASAGPDAIVYDQFGKLHLFDLKTGQSRPLAVRLAGDLAEVRPHMVKAAKYVRKAGLSPTGVRAVFEARGEILTVPLEKGDSRNLTNTPGVAERDPAWSPDGKWVAYFSDESGEYQLHLRPQSGLGEVKKIALGQAPSFYYSPVWSPDSKRIAYTDKALNFWYVDLATGKSTKVDTALYRWDFPLEPPSWSPDGRWLVYSRELKNYLHAVFLYSLDAGKKYQVTDGMSDARHAAFDKDGKHLYFLASTDVGPTLGAGMSVFKRGVTSSAYVVVLNKDDPSPLAPQSDEEKEEPADKDAPKKKVKEMEKDKKKSPKVRIDLKDIDQRILALPVPARDYTGLLTGKAGVVFLLEGPPVIAFDGGGDLPSGSVTVRRFDLEKRKAEKLVEGVRDVAVSHNGEKMLYRKGEGWFLVGANQPPKPGEGALKLDAVEVRVDPLAEWRQIYHEVYRIERDFLYDPNYHGLDLQGTWERNAKYLPGLGSRHDLNYLLEELLGRLCLGHVFVGGGDVPQVKGVPVGLLGADYRVENGRYQFARVYRGENWNPQLKAPLTQPGARVKEGEYLLAVNGQEVRGTDNVFRFFEGTAGKTVLLKVGPNANGQGSRVVKVVPVGSEYGLRNLAWVDDNRRKVDRLSNGRVAYIYMPDTHAQGFARFNRYYFAQSDKQAAVIDERFNSGGFLADYPIDYLRRPLRNYITSREGEDQVFPTGGIFGPKVMIINELAGSGGDYMPYTFRRAGLGPLVGKRTWGGLVGISGFPGLIDGGTVTAPNFGIWFPTGRWEVENRGVAPDIEVEFDPQQWRAGHDPQLEKAVAVVLEELKKHPPHKPKRPAFPNYYKKGLAEPAEGK